jgi:soluble lytic murein transglycosylase-like protein
MTPMLDLQEDLEGAEALPGMPLSRRAWLPAAAAIGASLCLPQIAIAGGQLEEPLADSVRGALSAAIADRAPPKPSFGGIEERLDHLRWLGEMGDRLKKHKAKVSAELQTRREFLETVWYETKRAGVDTSLVLGLIQVESAFRKYAVSVVGARGYMQVMPFWARLIGDGDARKLFHMQTNIRFGCVILRHYLDREKGNLFLTLGRYNGSRGRAEYPNAVFAAQKRWLWEKEKPADKQADSLKS